MHRVEAPAVHAFEHNEMPAGVGDGDRDRDAGFVGLATAVAIIFLAPSMVRRLPVVTYTYSPALCLAAMIRVCWRPK